MLHYANAHDRRIAEAIRGMLADVGIEVEIQGMENVAAQQAFNVDKKIHLNFSRWTGRPDPQVTVNNLFSSGSFFNVGGYSTPEIERLLAEAAAEYDNEKRAVIYAEISRLAILEEAIGIPILAEPSTTALRKNVVGYEPNMLGKSIYKNVWKDR